MLKLNKLLALVEASTPMFRKLIAEYKGFFEKKQGDFQGVRKEYFPKDGMADLPSERQFKRVVTTVAEKLQYFEDNSVEHLNNIMNVEATNASGGARVELKVGEFSFGSLSTLELMKLKSILEKEGLEPMYAVMPVRSDAEIWEPAEDELYVGRDIYETARLSGTKKTVAKAEYILEDPNVIKMIERGGIDVSRYTPVKSVKDTVVDLGDYTLQHFSGETTQRYRASVLARRSELKRAIDGALKEANDVAVVRSGFDAKQFFVYLHGVE